MAKHDIVLKKGDLLNDHYQVEKHIGSGGMSAVYLVKEKGRDDQHWAVKVADVKKKISKRLLSEAQILTELNHPAIPKVVDFFSSADERYFYLVQEYVDGQTLYDLFEGNDQNMQEDQLIEIALQLADVLHYLHTRSPAIIYRDLKPGNVMITTDGKIKLIDFGIARKYVIDKGKDTLQIGTVGFAAPEQFEKRQSDTRTDLFSLGALLYYLLTGGKYVYIAQKPVHFFRKGLNKHVRKCVDSLVELKPDDRIQTAEEVRHYFLKAKMKSESYFETMNWLITKYFVSFVVFIGVVLYIVLDQL